MDIHFILTTLSQKLNQDFINEFNNTQLKIVYDNLAILDYGKNCFYRKLIIAGIDNPKIIEDCDPNCLQFIQILITQNKVDILKYYITHNKFLHEFSQFICDTIFTHNFELWCKLQFSHRLNLYKILKLPLSEEAFRYIINNYDIMTPNLYYILWKYNATYLKIISKNCEISYFYGFDIPENPLAEHNIEYLKYLKSLFLHPVIYYPSSLFEKLCEYNCELHIWNFFMPLIYQLPTFINILSLKNYDIKKLVIDKYLTIYGKDILKSTVIVLLKHGNYSTITNHYIPNNINIDDCISICKKYFNNDFELDDFIKNGSTSPTKISYGKYIFNQIKR
jgi:hypothetical protein